MTDNPLAQIYRDGGSWSTAYLDVSGDVEDPRRMAEHRRRTASDALAGSGAPEADVERVDDILSDSAGVASPVSRFILVHEGAVALDETLPGSLLVPEAFGYGPVPDLVPLLTHRPSTYSYLVVEVGRDGGEVKLYSSGSALPESERSVEGSTDSINKVQVGGWSQARYQRHTEDVWKHNMDDIASAVDRLVHDHHPRLLLLAGDGRAVQLLEAQLSSESRAILSSVETNTRADGASDHALQSHLAEELARLAADDRRAAIDHLANRSGQDAASGVGEVVRALQQAQAESVLLDAPRLHDRTLLALAAEPWVATAPEETLGAEVLGEVSADVAITRAALLTDAAIVFIGSTDLPEQAEVAASLRWPTGPTTPGT